MGKISRERDAEVAREAILEAAEGVFAREGFDGARIDIIAAESGYNKSLIFHYFGDKEGLYRAIIMRLKARMSGDLLEPLLDFIQSSSEISEQRIRLFLELTIARYLDFLSRHPLNLRMMAWEAAEGWHTYMCKPEDKEIKAHRAVMLAVVDFLRDAQEAGVICPEIDVRCLLVNLMNMCIAHLLNLPRLQWLFEQAGDEQCMTPVYVRRQIIQLVAHGIFTGRTPV